MSKSKSDITKITSGIARNDPITSQVNAQTIQSRHCFTNCWPPFHIPIFCRAKCRNKSYPDWSVEWIIANNHIQIALSSKLSQNFISRLFCRANYRNESYPDCSVEQMLHNFISRLFGRANYRKNSYPDCSVEEMIAKIHIQIVLSRSFVLGPLPGK